MASVELPDVGQFIRNRRKGLRLTLEGLAERSGVSTSMLSVIERGETNPTLATVWALARALDVDVSEMIGVQKSDRAVRIDNVSPTATPELRTEDGLCVLRILSPADRADTLEWYDIKVAPGGVLASGPHARGTREHLTVLDGELQILSGSEQSVVIKGATARYPADVPHEIRNVGSLPARGLLVVTIA